MSEEKEVEKEVPAVEGGGDKERNEKGQWIPKVRMDEVIQDQKATKDQLQQEREARIRLEEQVKVLQAGKVDPVKIFTRAEVKAMMDEGKISQEQADEYFDHVTEAKIRDSLTKEIRTSEAQREKLSRVKSELDQYTALVPDVLKEGTDDRKQVAEEYKYLVSLGSAENIATELAALRSVYGPIDKLSKRKDMKSERESFQDGAGKGTEEKAKETGVPKGLPDRYKDYYAKMIDKGFYDGWNDPKLQKELKRANSEDLQRRAKKFGT